MCDMLYNKRQEHLIQALSNYSSCMRRRHHPKNKHRCGGILKLVENDVICLICDLVKNVLYKNIPVPNLTKQKMDILRKHKQSLLQLIDSNTTLGRRRKIINQSGGAFLPFLLPILSSIIGGIISATTT